MQNNFLQLDYIINVNNFQKIQDAMAEATEMAMLTVDFKGIPVTKHSRCNDFCKMVRSYPNHLALCNKCDSRGGLEATRLHQPYIYICHMGLLDLAIPIIVAGQYIGAVLAGQVLIKEDREIEHLERIVSDKYIKLDLEQEATLKKLYEKLPIMTLDRVNAVANMIFHISNYIVEEAILKINLNEINNNLLSLSSLKNTNNEPEKNSITTTYKYYELENPKDPINDKSNAKEPYVPTLLYKDNIILKPAIEYIQNNYHMAINLDDMASLCNISPSYFSKLFKKALEDNFANYINKIRIKKAKDLLSSSNQSIINIALDLGFEDSGYFIKVFKKLEGITPSVYRHIHSPA